jgi:hypothetical protein
VSDLQQPIDHIPPTPGEQSSGSDPIPFPRARDHQDALSQRKPENVAHLRPVETRDARTHHPPDVLAEPVGKVAQEQGEPALAEAPSPLQRSEWIGIAARFAIAMALSAVIAALFVVVVPAWRTTRAERTLLAVPAPQSPTWPSSKSSVPPAPQRKPAPTLVIREGSGPANAPLSVGVVVQSPASGAMVAIDGMPAGARLTAGRRVNSGAWRVSAEQISDALIIPPADFVGVMNLTAELQGSDGAALVSSVVRLTWAPVRPDGPVAGSATTMASGPATPAIQQQQATSSGPAGAAPAEPPGQEVNRGDVAGLVRRAQELLATGDLKASRVLLLRAAEARDARAAFSLAKTFDPILARQSGAANSQPDLVQARNWYRKAEEWGAPEAKQKLEALASHPR